MSKRQANFTIHTLLLNQFRGGFFVVKFVLLFLLLQLGQAQAQSNSWHQHLSFGSYDFARGMFPTPDGGYIAAGHTGNGPDLHQTFLVKFDPFGNEQWRQTYGGPQHDIIDDFRQTSDGGYLLCGTTFVTGGLSFEFWLTKLDHLGNLVWSNTYGGTPAVDFARAAIETSDGGYAMVGRTDDGSDVGILVVKTDANGVEEWSNIYGGLAEDEAWGIVESPDNQLVVTGQSKSFSAGDQDVYVAKIALDGTFQWFQTFGGADDDFAFDVLPVATGGYMVGGTTRSFGAGDYDVYLLKITDNGTLEWSQTYGGAFGEWGTYLVAMPDGGFAMAGSTQSFNNWFDDVYLVRTDASGSLLWQKSYIQDRKDIPHSIELAPDGGFLIAAHSRIDDSNGAVLTSQGYLLRTDPQGNLLTNYLQGRIFFDENSDCLPTAGEVGFGGWHLAATRTSSGGNTTFYGITDDEGNFSILTDSGNYVLRLVSPNSYWQPCENDISLQFSDLNDTLTANFPLQVAIGCPQLEVDVATQSLKPCSSVVYEVKYCNNGTLPAIGAELAVTLDSALSFVASQIPATSQTGLTYLFAVGDLGVGECGSFFIETFLDCAVGIGRTHTVTATATPDDICLTPDPQWDGASIAVQAVCEADSVRFTVSNTGAGGMTNPLLSIVVEDQILGRAIEYQLGPGETKEVTHPVNGKTLRLETPQSAGHPGKSRPSVSIEACGSSTGFVTMFPQDDADEFRSIHARENEILPSANISHAFPKGIDGQHFIKQNTDIEYLIAFQNTGTDTVATVVVQDTLSHWLDVTTVRQGAASHPYHLSVSNAGVLQFTLENTKLLPASVSDTGSVGFVKFRVSQLPDAPWDSLIWNRSCITMDYGEPVAKPQYFHTLQKPQVFSISDVSLCTGGLYGGVAWESDTTFFENMALPWADSLNYVMVDVGEFGATVVIDTFVNLGEPLNGWLLASDTTIVEDIDLGAGCDSIVVWNVEVVTGVGEPSGFDLLKISPNPFSNRLDIRTTHPIESIEVLDLMGRRVAISSDFDANQSGNTKISLSTASWPPGIYYIFAKTSAQASSPIKLVKN